jgi:hypothetical protein
MVAEPDLFLLDAKLAIPKPHPGGSVAPNSSKPREQANVA